MQKIDRTGKFVSWQTDYEICLPHIGRYDFFFTVLANPAITHLPTPLLADLKLYYVDKILCAKLNQSPVDVTVTGGWYTSVT